MVWGRSEEKLARYKSVMMAKGFTVETTFNTEEIANRCNLIVTATSASTALLKSTDIRQGTHIRQLVQTRRTSKSWTPQFYKSRPCGR